MMAIRKTPRGPAARVQIALAAALFLSVSIGFSTPAAAQDNSGFNFLRVPAVARSAALGGAGASFLDGASAFYNNPAGLSDPSGEATSTAPWGVAGEASLTHHEALGGLRQDVVTLGAAKGPDALALSFNTLYSESIDLTDPTGALQGTFGLTDIYAGGGIARTLGGGWRIGATAAYVNESIAGAQADTWSFSAGTRFDLQSVPGLSFGLAVLNLGSDAQFRLTDGTPGEKFSLPTAVSGGASYAGTLGKNSRFLVVGEARKASDEDLIGQGGLEFGYSMIALRGGGRIRSESTDITAGFGIQAGRFQFEYAFVTFGSNVDDTHRAELAVDFGL
jgi:hypothetical protein